MCGTSKAERMQFVVDCAKPVPMSFNFQNPTACSGFYNVPHPTDAGESKKTHTLSSAAQESVESEDHCREAWQKDLQRSARSQHGKGQCSGKRSIDTEQHNNNKCSRKSEKQKPRKPAVLPPPPDTRFTQWRKEERIYVCDKCNKPYQYKGKAKAFDGSYVFFKGVKEHGLKDFEDMLSAWENGVDFTWWCKECHAKKGTLADHQNFANQIVANRQQRTCNWNS